MRKARLWIKARRKKAKLEGLCVSCLSRPALINNVLCSICRARNHEAALAHLEHDIEAHATMLIRAQDDTEKCAITGRSLLALKKVGEKLSVDRIDSRLGYIDGNMRLIALSLNERKGILDEVSSYWVTRLLTKLQKVVDDRLSDVPGAVIKT